MDLRHPVLEAENCWPPDVGMPAPPVLPRSGGARTPNSTLVPPPSHPHDDITQLEPTTPTPTTVVYDVTDEKIFWMNHRPYWLHATIGRGGCGDVFKVGSTTLLGGFRV